MKKIGFILIILSVLNITAQAPKKFYTRFGGNGHDIGYGVLQTFNGQYAVTGSTSSFGNGNTDMYLALIDSMGWVRWQKSYGGFNNDIGRSIIQLKDSGFVIAGYTNSFGAGGYDVFVVRTDKSGNLIWQKTYGGMDWDFAYQVKESNGGDSLIICGSTYSYGYGKSDGYIIKTDMNGNFQWQKTYGGTEDDEFKSFTLTYNNQYAFGGTTKSMGDVNGDSWFLKTNLVGDSIISKNYGSNTKQFINKIVETTSNDFLMCGGNDSTGTDSIWSYFLNLNENGIVNYYNSFSKHTFDDQQFLTVLNSKNNDFVYIEKAYNSPANSKLEPTICLFGGPWYKSCNTYGSLDDDVLYDIYKTKDQGYVAFGYTSGFNSNLTDFFLVKMDTTLFGSSSVIGINEINTSSEKLVRVYPNISNSYFHLEAESSLLGAKTTLINSIGKIIRESVILDSKSIYSIEKFEPGLYFLNVEKENYSINFKIIKVE